jgi:FixJ family two-component response regulator
MSDVRALIAIVDDEEAVRQALARVLRASQFEVNAYANGQDFLESLADTVPDCVILDFQMPGMTGREVQRALTLAGQRVPVIVVTAHDQPALREQCLADGAVAYLAKPLRRDILIQAIDSAVRRATRA